MFLKKRKKISVLFLAILLVFNLLSIIAPAELLAGDCEVALGRCLVDAVIVGVLSGPTPGAIYAAWCGAGYAWCVQFY